MFETTEDNTYCCNFYKCVEENKHIFKNEMFMNRSQECRIVDRLTETQYIDMCERMRNKQNEAYKTYVENRDDIACRYKRKK